MAEKYQQNFQYKELLLASKTNLQTSIAEHPIPVNITKLLAPPSINIKIKNFRNLQQLGK